MIVVFCADELLRRRVVAEMSGVNAEVLAVRSCAAVDLATRARVRACVYVSMTLDAKALDELLEVQRSGICPPTIVVTTGTNKKSAQLGGLRLHGILALDKLSDLPALLDGVVTSRSAAKSFARVLAANKDTPAPLRGILLDTLRPEVKIPQRSAVLEMLDRSGTWLDQELRRAFRDTAQPWDTWVFVARTVRAKDLITLDGMSTTERLARELRIDRKTLMRAVRRVARVTSIGAFRDLSSDEIVSRAVNALGLDSPEGSPVAADAPDLPSSALHAHQGSGTFIVNEMM